MLNAHGGLLSLLKLMKNYSERKTNKKKQIEHAPEKVTEDMTARKEKRKRIKVLKEHTEFIERKLKEKLDKPFYLNGGGWRVENDWLALMARELVKVSLDSFPETLDKQKHEPVVQKANELVEKLEEMVDLLASSYGTEVKAKKKFLVLKKELLEDVDELIQGLNVIWKDDGIVACTETPNLDHLMSKLDELEKQRVKKRLLTDFETPEEWSKKMLKQLRDMKKTPVDKLDDSNVEDQERQSEEFYAIAKDATQKLDDISSLCDPDMDVDEFDEDRLKTQVKVFFDAGKKMYLYLKRRNKEFGFKIASEMKDLVQDSTNVLLAMEDYKNDLTDRTMLKVVEKAKDVKQR